MFELFWFVSNGTRTPRVAATLWTPIAHHLGLAGFCSRVKGKNQHIHTHPFNLTSIQGDLNARRRAMVEKAFCSVAPSLEGFLPLTQVPTSNLAEELKRHAVSSVRVPLCLDLLH